MRYFLTIVIGLLFAGCATTENYERILDSWVGVHVDELVSTWGPPDKSFDLSDGGKVIEYFSSRKTQYGGNRYTQPITSYHTISTPSSTPGQPPTRNVVATTTYITKTTPTHTVTQTCKTLFTLDKQGLITRWKWRGDDCRKSDSENELAR